MRFIAYLMIVSCSGVNTAALAQARPPVEVNLSPKSSMSYNQWRDAVCFSDTISDLSHSIVANASPDNPLGYVIQSTNPSPYLLSPTPLVLTNGFDLNAVVTLNANVRWLGMEVYAVGHRTNAHTSGKYHIVDVYLKAPKSDLQLRMNRARMPIETERVGSSYEIVAINDQFSRVSCYQHYGSSGFSD
jgi:hypothetical protein